MQVIGVTELQAQGPRPSMQDAITHGPAAYCDAYILSLSDGHGEHGHVLAQLTSAVVRDVAEGEYQYSDEARLMPVQVGITLKALNRWFRKSMSDEAENSGSTNITATVLNNRIELAYLGDSPAYWVPDHGDIVELITAHNRHDPDEALRAILAGGDLRPVQFEDGSEDYRWFNNDSSIYSNCLEPTRSMGDFAMRFVLNTPDFTSIDPDGPGNLVLISDGLVSGSALFPGLEDEIRNGTLTEQHIKDIADKTTDNASILIARVE